VVIPVRDMAAFVGEAVDSVLAQHDCDPELIVVDDGSADASADVARRHVGGRGRVVTQEPGGEARARNRGLAECRGDRVLFLDADDRLRPDALARLSGALDAEAALAVAYGEVVSIDEEGRVFGTGRRPLFKARPSGDVLRHALRGNFIVTPGAALIRRAALARRGPFRDLPFAADWELYCRLALEGPFRYVGGAPVVEYRSHPRSLSATRGEQVDWSWPAVETVFGNPAFAERLSTSELREIRSRRIAGSYAQAGRQALKNGRYGAARKHLVRALLLEPARPREAILLLATLARWLPASWRRRLK
jgi:glycosyltransferase involved in cell wall biosynthesis